MTEVEIIWPVGLAQDRLGDAADELSAAGTETTCRIQPVRRGAENPILVLMTTSALEPFLQAMFGRIGEGATHALKRFVAKLFGRDAPQPSGTGAGVLDVVIFESTATGAQFRSPPTSPPRPTSGPCPGTRTPSRAAGCGTPARATGSGSRARAAGRKNAMSDPTDTDRPTTTPGEDPRARSGASRCNRRLPPSLPADRAHPTRTAAEPPPTGCGPGQPAADHPQQFYGAQQAAAPPPHPGSPPPHVPNYLGPRSWPRCCAACPPASSGSSTPARSTPSWVRVTWQGPSRPRTRPGSGRSSASRPGALFWILYIVIYSSASGV